ncbi:putative membrane protein [Pyrobaculum oguniense TE7]|uniref:Membrane protein n=1 Tax=Pyrobaculum oguniense (strain DSM 13380 / JCM 10595 / TE7) TaxID=698757 RepID=H6QAY3_PYROT|nr:putative membrane protein [Pyrobaculum oguniense TE7]
MLRYLYVIALALFGAVTWIAGMREAAVILIAASGLLHTIGNKPSAFCSKYRVGGCEAVLSSPYARPFGIPLEVVGAAWFAFLPLAYFTGFGAFWSVLTLLGVSVLVAIELKLRAVCIYCTVAHAIGAVAAVLLLLA